MEELAAFAAKMPADNDKRLEERDWAEVVDLHMASHGEDVERTVELAHGFVEESGDKTSVEIAGWAFVVAIEFDMGGCDGVLRVVCVCGEDEMKALGIGGTAAEAVIGELVESGASGHGLGCVAGFVG
jgi:hypothetical protein